MKKTIKRITNRFKSKKLAKALSSESNSNIIKIQSDVEVHGKAQRINLLRGELFEILCSEEDISKRYKTWGYDFVTHTQNEFGIGVGFHSNRVLSDDEFKPVPEGTNDLGNLFPGITFDCPFFYTPEMSLGPLTLNALGVLILSNKFNPTDQIVLRVTSIDTSSWDYRPRMFFKIIKIFNSSDFKNEDIITTFYTKKRPVVTSSILSMV